MAIAERTAETTWEGPLASGSGTIRPASGALGELAVTWASRTEQPGGKTSPEELAAAAHSSCFAMALALRLGERKAVPQRLSTRLARHTAARDPRWLSPIRRVVSHRANRTDRARIVTRDHPQGTPRLAEMRLDLAVSRGPVRPGRSGPGGLQAEVRSAARELAAGTIVCSPLARVRPPDARIGKPGSGRRRHGAASPAAATDQPDAL